MPPNGQKRALVAPSAATSSDPRIRAAERCPTNETAASCRVVRADGPATGRRDRRSMMDTTPVSEDQTMDAPSSNTTAEATMRCPSGMAGMMVVAATHHHVRIVKQFRVPSMGSRIVATGVERSKAGPQPIVSSSRTSVSARRPRSKDRNAPRKTAAAPMSKVVASLVPPTTAGRTGSCRRDETTNRRACWQAATRARASSAGPMVLRFFPPLPRIWAFDTTGSRLARAECANAY